MGKKRRATIEDLFQCAYELRAQGHRDIYVFPGEEGVIRFSRNEPTHAIRYVAIGPTGRIWVISAYGQ